MNSVTPFLPYYNNCQNIMLWALSYMLVAEHIEKAHIFSKELTLLGKLKPNFNYFLDNFLVVCEILNSDYV